MQKLAIFTAILLSSAFSACGFYPYGEDVRFHFFNPDNFSYNGYSSFYYSSLSFEQSSENIISNEDNEKLWQKYCENKVSLADVSSVLEGFSYSDIHANSPNLFLKYLYSKKDSEAINYLKFAKNCEFFNTWQDDPWERNQNTVKVNRSSILNKAITLAHTAKRAEVKRRYAFLAIRLAFYNQDMKQINTIYDQYFSPDTSEDIIDSWALYFKAIAENNAALKNIYFANVFAQCPDKRFVSWQYFNSKIAEKDVLNDTKNNIEKANVSLLYGIYNPGKNLDNLKQIYTYNPKSEGLGFLLSREINKLEDWVYTPYYTLFDPSMISSGSGYAMKDNAESESIQQVLKRSEFDRKYAAEVLEFINSVDLSKVNNPDFWKFAKAELLLMTKNYKESLQQISKLEKSLSKDSKIRENLDQIKVLNLFANQTYRNAVIPESTKEIIIKNKNNRRFIFALGRELEYLGNTDDAALLYASMDHTFSENDYSSYNYVYYKSLKNNNKTYGDYFENSFNYLDAVYTSEQLLSFIKKAKDTEGKTDLFSQNFKLNKSSVQALYDLLGTKYMRENKLNFALNTFQKLGKDYYDNQYSLWERKDQDAYNDVIFDENPFYHLKYTPDFIPEKEEFRLNKISITQKLIEYKNKADNPKEKDRDYYYFLVANCYYNMSQYGNVWMMKRYFKGSQNFSFREDNEEFMTANLAKFYYGKAFENAKTNKFKALCLRMQGRCENYRLDFEQEKKVNYFSPSDHYEDERLKKNSSYQKLKNNYPDQYEDMMSTCDFFTSYFKARR
jgi:hypothetical protein